MPINTLLGFLFINFLWAAHPLIAKWMLLEMKPMEAAWMRYTSAFLAYLSCAAALVLVGKIRSKLGQNGELRIVGQHRVRLQQVKQWTNWNQFFCIPDKLSEKLLLVLMGVLAFCISPLIQIQGLSTSLATENSIIIALEPLMTVFLAWMFLREAVSLFEFFGICFALLGFSFLTDLWRSAALGVSLGSHFYGNLLIALSLVGEASFSVLGKKLVRNYSPLGIFGSALAVGVLCLNAVVAAIALKGGVSDFLVHFLIQVNSWNWKTFLAIFWIGPLGTALGYLIYITALVEVSVIAATLFLFLQPLMGAVLGYLFLRERLNGLQCFGSALMLLAVLIPNALQLRNRTTH